MACRHHVLVIDTTMAPMSKAWTVFLYEVVDTFVTATIFGRSDRQIGSCHQVRAIFTGACLHCNAPLSCYLRLGLDLVAAEPLVWWKLTVWQELTCRTM